MAYQDRPYQDRPYEDRPTQDWSAQDWSYQDRSYQDRQPEHWKPPRRGFPIGGVLLVIIILAAIGAVVYFVLDATKDKGGGGAAPVRTGTPTPSATADPAAQAKAIDSLLDDSAAGRARLNSAVNDISACHVTATTTANIQAAIDSRADLITRLDGLAVTAIPEGAELKTELRAALTASYEADVAYLEWVQAAGTACPRTTDPKYAAINAANTRATQAKVAFVATWNPVAVRYGLPKTNRTAGEI